MPLRGSAPRRSTRSRTGQPARSCGRDGATVRKSWCRGQRHRRHGRGDECRARPRDGPARSTTSRRCRSGRSPPGRRRRAHRASRLRPAGAPGTRPRPGSRPPRASPPGPVPTRRRRDNRAEPVAPSNARPSPKTGRGPARSRHGCARRDPRRPTARGRSGRSAEVDAPRSPPAARDRGRGRSAALARQRGRATRVAWAATARWSPGRRSAGRTRPGPPSARPPTRPAPPRRAAAPIPTTTSEGGRPTPAGVPTSSSTTQPRTVRPWNGARTRVPTCTSSRQPGGTT